MNFRTDLALEVRENLEGSRIDGVECTSFESAGAEITRLRVTDRRGEEILGKPRGEYITVQSQSFARSSRISDELIDAVAQELSRLLPSEGTVLAAGLGNTNITPDALGPKFIGGVFVTRHLKREAPPGRGDSTRSARSDRSRNRRAAARRGECDKTLRRDSRRCTRRAQARQTREHSSDI